MKKSTFIIIGIVIILVLLLTWVYLLFFRSNDNSNGNIFANLGIFNKNGDETLFEPNLENDDDKITLETSINNPLRQLTTRRVIGFVELSDEDKQELFVQYMEAGTGHIYKINLNSGAEERISATTLPQASRAEFSSDGQTVAVQVGKDILLGKLGDKIDLDNQKLPYLISDFTFTNQGKLLFTEKTSTGTVGKILNTDNLSTNTIFSIPLQSITMIWDKTGEGDHFLYPKVSNQLPGYLYSLKNGQLHREPFSGNGLTAMVNKDYIVYNVFTPEGTYESKVINRKDRLTTELTMYALPEKCDFDKSSNNLYCAGFSGENLGTNFPENWYKGLTNYDDAVWRANLDTLSGFDSLFYPKATQGRELDITNLMSSVKYKVIYFINNQDQTLWYYAN